MAQRRMFSPQIVDSDAFLDMPASAQSLYFHLGMRADDDGFVGNPKKILRMVGGTEDDLKILYAKRYILAFESGVIVIKHWRINNLIRKDWYKETSYQDEFKQLKIKENGAYTELVNENAPNPTHRLGKVSLGKDSLISLREEEETPAQVAENFFTNQEFQTRIINDLISKGVPQTIAEREITKFISYWTEPTKNGKRQRWQMEQTFEINRRLTTWFSRIKDFNKSGTMAVI